MFHETAIQGRVLLLLLLAGMAAGAGYDLLSPLRRRFPAWAGAILDIGWCLTAAALALLALALGGESRARPYAALGLLCGGGLYFLGIHTVGAAFLRMLRRLFQERKDSSQSKVKYKH